MFVIYCSLACLFIYLFILLFSNDQPVRNHPLIARLRLEADGIKIMKTMITVVIQTTFLLRNYCQISQV